MAEIDKEDVVAVLNRILESELAGVVRYTHYSFLVFGFGRIPIRSWLREQADESLLHARQVENGSPLWAPIRRLRSVPSSTRTHSISLRSSASRCKPRTSRWGFIANCSRWSRTAPLHSRSSPVR